MNAQTIDAENAGRFETAIRCFDEEKALLERALK
jgi:hypothetical protein